MTTLEIGKQLVELCKQGKNREALDKLYSKDITSIEAGAPPGQSREAKGIEALNGKLKWWEDNHEVHSAKVEGPFPHDDRFAVHFTYDITHKPSGQRFPMDEIALYTVKDDKIVREEFFYSMPG